MFAENKYVSIYSNYDKIHAYDIDKTIQMLHQIVSFLSISAQQNGLWECFLLTKYGWHFLACWNVEMSKTKPWEKTHIAFVIELTFLFALKARQHVRWY